MGWTVEAGTDLTLHARELVRIHDAVLVRQPPRPSGRGPWSPGRGRGRWSSASRPTRSTPAGR